MKKIYLLFICVICSVYSKAELAITLNVENAGSLATMIASSKKNMITSLTITGNINGSDIRFIRQMAGYKNFDGALQYLDLSGANIVSGGESYSYERYRGSYGYTEDTDRKCYTKNNVVSSFMFDNIGELDTLILPNSVTKIEQDAFLETNLISITLPEKLDFLEATIPSWYLSEIIISNTNSNFKVENKVLYSKDNKTLYRCCVNYEDAKFVIPEGTEDIFAEAFNYCRNIKKFSYPKSLKSFGASSLGWMDLDEFVFDPNISYSSLGNFTTIEKVIIEDGHSNFDAYPLGPNSYLDRQQITVKEVWCKCITPPTMETWHLFNTNTLKGTLYIPKGSFSAYYIAYGWGDFKNIVETTDFGEDVDEKKCATPIITYSDGTIKYNSNTTDCKFHYSISSPDIKSGTSYEEVELVAFYEISVYATAEGYSQSDVAKAKLYWIDGNLSDPSNINTIQKRGIMIKNNNGKVEISGLDNNEEVSFYSIDGMLLGKANAIGDTVQFTSYEKIIIAKFKSSSIKIVAN